MKLFDFIDKAYYINLRSRTDKKKVFEEHFKEIGLFDFVERFEAVEPTMLGFQPDENGIYEHIPTSKACLYSHLAIIEKAKADGLSNVLIFEDDARFITDENYHFDDIIRSAIETLNSLPRWDVFFLGTNSGTREEYFEQYGPNLVKTPESLGTHGVVINSSVFQEILDNARNSYAFDIFLSTHFEHKYLVYPLVVYQGCGLINDVGQNFKGYSIDFWKKTYDKKLIKKY